MRTIIENKAKAFYLEIRKSISNADMFTLFRFVGCTGLLIKVGIDKPEKYYNERCSLAYLSITYKELVGPYDLMHYYQDLEKYYGIPQGLVSGYYLELLQELGPDNVETIFSILKHLDLQSDELADFCDRLFNFANVRFGMKDGTWGANPALSDLMGRLARAESGMTLYDGFCGTGRTIIEADNGCRLYMQDVDPTVLALAAVNAVIHGKRPEGIMQGDALLNPLGGDMKYDRIVTEPPLEMKYSPDYTYAVGERLHFPPELINGDTAAIAHTVERLNENGIGVVLVPMSFLFKSGRAENLRKYLVENNYLDCVITLPSGAIPNTGTATALLIIKKGKDQDKDGVFYIDSTDIWIGAKGGLAYLTDKGMEKIMSIYTDRAETEISTYVDKGTILQVEVKLSPAYYLVQEHEIEVADTGALIKRSADLYKRFLEVNEELEKLRGGTFDD